MAAINRVRNKAETDLGVRMGFAELGSESGI